MPQLLASAVSRWWDDPYSRGAWSLLRVGGSPGTRSALGSPFGRVVIAGEATHPTQAGMVHGAVEEGVRAANHVLSLGCGVVAIVGAGAAGCGAASVLRDAGVQVMVFEARNRIGGRVHSVEPIPGVWMELGANWLQQGDRNTLADFAVANGFRLVDTDFHRPSLHGYVPDVSADVTAAVVENIRERTMLFEGDDRSLRSIVDEMLDNPWPWTREVVQAVVDGEVAIDAGAPLDTLSARNGFEPGVGEGDRWVVEGYERVLEVLLGETAVTFSTPIECIEWGSAGVTLHSPRLARPVDADAVIVTVPAAVLGAGTPSLVPELPATQRDALDAITVGRVEKAVLVYDERWWPESPSSYLRVFGSEPGCVSEWLDLTDAVGQPAITGLFVGEWVASIWGSPDDQTVAARAGAVLREHCSLGTRLV